MNLDRQAPRISAMCLTILAATATGATVYWLRPVLVPFVLALFLSVIAEPVVLVLTRRLRIPRGLAVITTLLLGVAVVLLFSAVVATAVAQLHAGLDGYIEQLRKLEHRVAAHLTNLGFPTTEWLDDVLSTGQIASLLAMMLRELLSLVSQAAVVLIFLYFLLATHSEAPIAMRGTWAKVRRSIAQYLSVKIAISLLTAVVVGVTLFALSVPLALSFAFLVFLLNFIPSVGSIIATLLPIPVVIGSDELSSTTVVLAILIPAAVQFVIGEFIDPRVTGKSLDLHPVAVLFGLMFWGMLWGLVGVLLAVPMTAAIKIVLDELGYTKPVADLLAGKQNTESGQSAGHGETL